MLKRTITLSLLILSLTMQAQWKDGGTKITTTQNVGIGTENPLYKLDIIGNTRSQNLILPNGYQMTRNINDNFTYQEKSVGHYSIGWNSDSWYSGGGTLWQSGYGGIKFFTNSQLRIAINHSGNVGIGTDNPQYKLDVNGNIAASSLYLKTKYVENGWRNTIFEYDGHNLVIGSKEGINAHNSLVIKPGGAGKEQLYSSIILYSTSKDNQYQQKVKIITEGNSYFNAGNVGIGTDKPLHKLDVLGTIRATEVKVEAAWADFVFDKDYKLRSLDDVKAHIQEYKHLPDIPSEKEVQEQGINIGEMQAKLLQKIEELTLYVIELKEENKHIQEENKIIKQRLQDL